MTNFENIKQSCVNAESFAKWLHSVTEREDGPWCKWFDEKYCYACEPQIITSESSGRPIEYAWCELHNYKCKHFKNCKSIPAGEELIKIWLEGEC